MIFPIWKKVGWSTHEIARMLSLKQGIKTSHTGTLDPMAEGVVIVLGGEERHKKYEYASWKKTYEFDVVFGAQTDTYDFLGLVSRIAFPPTLSTQTLKKVLKTFEGDYVQQVPVYSAIKVGGKPLHWYARNNKLSRVTLPQKTGKIYAIKLVDFKTNLLKTLIESRLGDINSVYGDLRQIEVVKGWQDLLMTYEDQEVFIAKVEVEMSKGLYVRSLSQDICKQLDTVGFVFQLVRTKNGKYSKKDCTSIDTL